MLLCFAVLLAAGLLALRSSAVQTTLTHELAAYYSAKLHTRVTVGKVDVAFFKKLVLKDVCVEDLHRDTLVFFNELRLNLSRLSFSRRELVVSDLELINPTVKLIQYKNENDFNFKFLLDAFAGAKSTVRDSSFWKLKCDEIIFHNLSFCYRTSRDTIPGSGMNYDDIDCRQVFGVLKAIHFKGDSLFVRIDQLAAREKCGFVLNNLSTRASISPLGINCRNLEIKTPGSSVHGDFKMSYSGYRDFRDFISKVDMKSSFDSARVDMSDIAFFAPALKGMNRTVSLSGEISGKVNALKGRKLRLQLDQSSFFDGDIDLDSIPETEKLFLGFKVRRFVTNVTDLQHFQLYPFDSGKRMELPAKAQLPGDIIFKGTVYGLLNDFNLSGVLSTSLGSISAVASAHEDTLSKLFYYKGTLASEGFDIGKLLAVPKLGLLASDLKFEGNGLSAEKASVTVEGKANSFSVNNYSYKNTVFSARYTNKVVNADLTIDDENCRLKCGGSYNIQAPLPDLDIALSLQQANLNALGFVKGKTNYVLTTGLAVHTRGNSIDNLTGTIDIRSTRVKADKVTYNFKSFSLSSSDDSGLKHLNVSSDIVDGDITGSFVLKDIRTSLEGILGSVIPAYFSPDKLLHSGQQKFDFALRIKNSKDITKLFFPSFEIAEGTRISGACNSSLQTLQLSVKSPNFRAYGNKLNGLDMRADLKDGKLDLTVLSEKAGVTDSVYFKNLIVDMRARHDSSSSLSVIWANHSQPDNSGNIKAKIVFGPEPSIEFGFLPSSIVVTDSLWKVNSANRVRLDSSHLSIHQVEFSNNNQQISIDGDFSRYTNDSMYIQLKRFNLATLNRWTNDNFKLKGIVNGTTVIAGKLHSALIINNTSISGLKINNNEIGEGFLKSSWESDKNALELNGSFSKGAVQNILFSGFYYPDKNNSMDLDLSLATLNLDLFKPFVRNYCRDLSGTFSGKLRLKGTLAKPEVSGTMNVDASKVTVDYLGTSYSFKHEIRIEPGSFSFNDLIVHDRESGTALVKNGKLFHDNFSNFKLDVDFAPNKLMVLNTTANDNDLYYGQAYVTGPSVRIYGLFNKMIYIDANVKTDRVTVGKKPSLTKLYIPLSNTTDVTQSNFISFVSHDTSAVKKSKYTVDLSGFTLNFDLDVTTDAEVHLIFDQKIGDVINAVGTGPLKLEINSLGKFEMLGNYTVESGDYLFTLQNVINKKFVINKGATIKWSGSPYEAEINMDAIYKVKANLGPLAPIPGMDTTAAKKRYPVDCKLSLSNKLMSPDIGFEVDLPTVDESTRSYVKSVINTDLEINRQVFSLMVLGSFITPQSMSGGSSASDLLPSSGLMAGSELLTNQLNNMLGKLSNDFDVGVRVAADKLNNEDLQLALSTQLLNNRLLLDGNFGKAAGATQNTNTLVGDMNVEYKLTNDGKIRLKAFNRTNDNTIINISSPYTQGVGIFYRVEFNLFEKRIKKKKDAAPVK